MKILASIVALFILLAPISNAQVRVYQGGTGLSTVPLGYVLTGSGDNFTLTAVATSSLGITGGGSVSGGTAGTLTSWLTSSSLNSTSTPTAANFWATSTVASRFPFASTTQVSATSLCLSTDCRTVWPSLPTNYWSLGCDEDTCLYYNNGSIGIGTSVPSGKLHVKTLGTNDLGFQITDSLDVSKVTFYANGLAYFAGNVGIGTTSPYAKLSVAGQIVGQYVTATSTATSTFPFASINKNTFMKVSFGEGDGGQANQALFGFNRINFGSSTGYTLTDPGGNWNAANNRYVVPRNGTYMVVANVRTTDGTIDDVGIGTGNYSGTAGLDSATFHWQEIPGLYGGARNTVQDTNIEHYNAGDTIIMFGYSDLGSTASDGAMTIYMISSD